MKSKFLVGLGAILGLSASVAGSVQARPLDLFQWERRVLVLFADRDSDPWAFRQKTDLLEDACAFANRDLVLLEVYSDEPVMFTGQWLDGETLQDAALRKPENDTLRQEYSFDRGFGLVLIGKDGFEKRRSRLPENIDQIFGQIDAMPMRRDEAGFDKDC